MPIEDILADTRFRAMVRQGDYTRAITVFLRLQYPDVEDLASLPFSVRREAQGHVDGAFFAKLEAIEEMEREMR